MELKQEYELLADTDQEYAVQNNSTHNKILYIVKSETKPSFDNDTNNKALKFKSGFGLTSADLPAKVWGACNEGTMYVGIQKY